MKKTFLCLLFSACLILLLAPVAQIQAFSLEDLNVTQIHIDPANPSAGVAQIIALAVKAVFGVIGAFAFFMIVYGGFWMFIATGNKTKYEHGKEIVIWAVIGLVVILISYALVDFALRALTT